MEPASNNLSVLPTVEPSHTETQPSATSKAKNEGDKAEKAPKTSKQIVRKALKKAVGGEKKKPSAMLKSNVIEALADLKQNDPAEYADVRVSLGRLRVTGQIEAIIADAIKADQVLDAGTNSEERSSASSMLLELAEESCTFFHDTSDESYAQIERDGHTEIWMLCSDPFIRLLKFMYYKATGRGAPKSAVDDAIATLEGKAQFEGECREVFMRVAEHEGSYYIDLGNDDWNAVRINADGWEFVSRPPVAFARSSSMLPMPTPEHGGSVDGLWGLANVPVKDRPLVLAYILESYRPDTPHQVLEVGGEYGAGKSNVVDTLHQVIDPNEAKRRSAPAKAEDVYIAAANGHFISYDNMSYLSPSMQDVFCGISTGNAYTKRAHYKNKGQVVIKAKKPVIFTSTTRVATALDLVNRTITIEPLKLKERMPEKDMDRLRDDMGKTFGALLTLFANALKGLPDVDIETDEQGFPRMTDFAQLGESMYRSMGKDPGAWLTVYRESVVDAVMCALEAQPVAWSLIQHFDEGGKPYIHEMTSVVFKDMTEQRIAGGLSVDRNMWVGSPRHFGEKLRIAVPGLRLASVSVVFHERESAGRPVSITKDKPEAVENHEF